MGQSHTKEKLLCVGDMCIKHKESQPFPEFKAYLTNSGGKKSIHLFNGVRAVDRISPVWAVKRTLGMLHIYVD